MARDEGVPQEDAVEQHEAADGSGDVQESLEVAGGLGERPEADTIEQSMAVENEQRRDRHRPGDDVPEADWLEQQVAEPFEDDR